MFLKRAVIIAGTLFVSTGLSLKAATGVLKITSSPNEISVSVNGENRGMTNNGTLILELAAGSHEVSASLPNYDSSRKTVKISVNQVTTVDFRLQKASGFKIKKAEGAVLAKEYGGLTVLTDIPGAKVKLNGTQVGETTPFTAESVAAGRWEVVAELNGKIKKSKVSVKAGETSVARLFFDPAKEKAYLKNIQDEQNARLAKQQAEAEEARNKVKEESLLEQPLATFDYSVSSYSLPRGNITGNDYKDHALDSFRFNFLDLDGQNLELSCDISFSGTMLNNIWHGDYVGKSARVWYSFYVGTVKIHEIRTMATYKYDKRVDYLYKRLPASPQGHSQYRVQGEPVDNKTIRFTVYQNKLTRPLSAY